MNKEWIKMIPKITENLNTNNKRQCPNCGKFGIDYLYIGDATTRIGYLQIWCNECLKGIYVSRAVAPVNANFVTFDEDVKNKIPDYEYIED